MIRLITERGTVTFEDGQWAGPGTLVDLIEQEPLTVEAVTVVGPYFEPNVEDEQWQFVRAMRVLHEAGRPVVAVAAAPPMPSPPAGAVQ